MFLRKIAMAGALVLGTAAPALAQGQCVSLCEVSCLKPISLPDRWDDATGIPGYMGEGGRRPNWRNNASWDQEAFVDANANGLWDPGETFSDGNSNGVFDRELYDPLSTGYVPATELGLELVLTPDNDAKPTPGQVQVIDFPAINRGTPITGGEFYSLAWVACAAFPTGAGDRVQLEPGNMVGPTNQIMRDLIAQDPSAYWDPATMSVQGSAFAQSPRVILFPIHDPRIPITSSNFAVIVTKIAAFFMEQMEGNAAVRGRFMRAMGVGSACAGAGDGFVVECPTPARPTSWGHVKDLYR